nr:hypothetical protein [Paramuribaculum intestinale]
MAMGSGVELVRRLTLSAYFAIISVMRLSLADTEQNMALAGRP